MRAGLGGHPGFPERLPTSQGPSVPAGQRRARFPGSWGPIQLPAVVLCQLSRSRAAQPASWRAPHRHASEAASSGALCHRGPRLPASPPKAFTQHAAGHHRSPLCPRVKAFGVQNGKPEAGEGFRAAALSSLPAAPCIPTCSSGAAPPHPCSQGVWGGAFFLPSLSTTMEVKARGPGALPSRAEEAPSCVWVRIPAPACLELRKMPAAGNAGTHAHSEGTEYRKSRTRRAVMHGRRAVSWALC